MNHINELTLIYDLNKTTKPFNMFGLNFINNNKNYLKVIFNEKEFSLDNISKIKSLNENKDKFQIILKGNNNIKDLSFMFYECE